MANANTTAQAVTVRCLVGRHGACKGQLVSLVVRVGTPCACACHQHPAGKAA